MYVLIFSILAHALLRFSILSQEFMETISQTAMKYSKIGKRFFEEETHMILKFEERPESWILSPRLRFGAQ